MPGAEAPAVSHPRPAETAGSVTPVGVPLGQHVAMVTPAVAIPAAPPPEGADKSGAQGWVPADRQGRVGKSLAAAVDGGELQAAPTNKASRLRRSSRQRQTTVLASIVVAGVCLLLLLILLLIVAINR